jgi:chemotaxis protein MotB
MKKTILVLLVALIGLSSCVSKKKYQELNSKYEASERSLVDCKANLMKCRTEDDAAISKIAFLQDQIQAHKDNISQLQKALDKCVNMSEQGNTNIGKLLDEINSANKYIRKLTAINHKNDSLTLALSNKFKRSLNNLDDEDINVKVKKGVVFVSLSDEMMFNSGSYTIKEDALPVLSKISKIVNDYKDYDILIEGHTDNVPISNGFIKDNWDLSAMRATSIARFMQTDLSVNPARITAGARSEYVPKASNDTAEGRKTNRRTEIIVLPKLDEFIKMMEEAPTTE